MRWWTQKRCREREREMTGTSFLTRLACPKKFVICSEKNCLKLHKAMPKPISDIPHTHTQNQRLLSETTSRQPYWSNFNAKFSMKWAFSTLVSGKPQLSHSEKWRRQALLVSEWYFFLCYRHRQFIIIITCCQTIRNSTAILIGRFHGKVKPIRP